MNLFATAIIKNINKKKFHVPKRLYKILRFIKRIPVNHSNKYLAMWKYRLDFNLSYYVLFVNIANSMTKFGVSTVLGSLLKMAEVSTHLEFSDFFRRFTYIYI